MNPPDLKTIEVITQISKSRHPVDTGGDPYWVGRAWLAIGEVDKARAVLERAYSSDLEHIVLDAEEFYRLGEHSVYPETTPHHKRWLPPPEGYSKRVPAQVLVTDQEGLTLVYGIRRDQAVIWRLSWEQWTENLSKTKPKVGEFLEIFEGELGLSALPSGQTPC